MNEVFLIGNIVNEIEFKFIINSKNISIAMFNIETDDKQVIKIKAYNEENIISNKKTESGSSTADELIKLKSLLDAGVITQEEFDAKKKQILGI